MSSQGPLASWRPLLLALGLVLSGCRDRVAEQSRVQANALLKSGDAAGALKACDEGLAQRPGDAALLIHRGNALFELERFDEAKAAYEAALAAGRDREPAALSDAHRGLAMVATRQQDWAAARAQFEELVAINPKDSRSHANVAKACLQLRDLACAISHAETAGHLRGDDEGVLVLLGTVYLEAGRGEEAELTFRHICDVVPGAASCPYGEALVAARAGDKKKALDALDEAIRRKLPNPDQIAHDPGFAGMREDPEFQKIVARASHP
jgi:tetratricopeptide (TPR) repeat protein